MIEESQGSAAVAGLAGVGRGRQVGIGMRAKRTFVRLANVARRSHGAPLEATGFSESCRRPALATGANEKIHLRQIEDRRRSDLFITWRRIERRTVPATSGLG